MIFLLCCWAALLVAARLAGVAILTLTSSGQNLDRGSDLFFAQVWTGLFSLASLLLALSAIHRLSPALSLCALCAVLTLALLPRVRRQARWVMFSATECASFALILLIVAWIATAPVDLWDTGLYHYQMVRWLNQAGTVPGLALLHFRFGWSSSWFALTAALDSGLFQGVASTALNSLALAIAVFHLAIAASRVLSRTARNGDAFLVGALPGVCFLCLVQRLQVSPSPNLPAALGTVMCGWAMVMARRGEARDWNLPLLLAAGAAGVKLICVPLLAAAGGVRILAGRSGRIIATALASAAIFAPAIVANRISSGCPFYPASVFCTYTASSVSHSQAEKVAADTANWARYDGPYPKNASFFDGIWIWKWLRAPLNAAFAGIAVLAICAAFALRTVDAALVVGTLASGALFVAGPTVRFLSGPVGILCGCLTSSVYQRLQLEKPRVKTSGRWLTALTVVACAILIRDSVLREQTYRRETHRPFQSSNAKRLLLPAAIQASPSHWLESRTAYIGYRIPEGDNRCWALPLPCTPYPPPSNLGYCRPGIGIAGGFCLQAASPVKTESSVPNANRDSP